MVILTPESDCTLICASFTLRARTSQLFLSPLSTHKINCLWTIFWETEESKAASQMPDKLKPSTQLHLKPLHWLLTLPQRPMPSKTHSTVPFPPSSYQPTPLPQPHHQPRCFYQLTARVFMISQGKHWFRNFFLFSPHPISWKSTKCSDWFGKSRWSHLSFM